MSVKLLVIVIIVFKRYMYILFNERYLLHL